MTAPVTFFKETYDELTKVVWPSRAEIFRLTAIVILLSVIMGLYIGGLDYIFNLAVQTLLK